jgi:hypothetical protein
MIRAISKSTPDDTEFEKFVQVYDIENEIGREFPLNPSGIRLDGMSQINVKGCLYLCGNKEKVEHEGSFFFKVELSNKPTKIQFLVNTIHCHYYPSMANKEDSIVLVGGKQCLKVEIYSPSVGWRSRDSLPEERFRCSLFIDEKNYLYLFGGYNSSCGKILTSILRLNLQSNITRWETLLTMSEKASLLSRIDSVVCRLSPNSVLILGGTTNHEKLSDDIIEFKLVEKSSFTINRVGNISEPCKFSTFNVACETDNSFFLMDDANFVHKINKKDFSHSSNSFFSITKELS